MPADLQIPQEIMLMLRQFKLLLSKDKFLYASGVTSQS